MTATALYGSLVIGAVAVLQSTVLRFVEIAGVSPDLVLIIVIFLANKNGSMTGQVAGFVAGAVLDMLGLAPLGFHALVFTLLGALYGLTRGKMFVDPIFVPVIMTVVAMLLKAAIALIVAALFAIESVSAQVFSSRYLIEIAYTGLLGPLVFGLLGFVRRLQPDRRRGEIV
ncbi:MAG: rod shape-determining protein MreD [Spirochaetota bacterium]